MPDPVSDRLSEGDTEEVSITIFDENGEVVVGETPEPEVTPEPTVDPSLPVYEADGSILLTMTFAGDMTIGSNVQSSGTSIFEKELEKQKGDINFPFRNVRDILLADDLTMVNFEGTLTTEGRNPDKTGNEFLFRADPSYVDMLPAGGVDTVSLENNHVLDMGDSGLEETKETLLAAGIPYASEGEPAILTVKGVKIGSLAYQTFGGRHDELIAKVPGDIQALRDQGCDIVIVSYHWGAEKDYYPNGTTRSVWAAPPWTRAPTWSWATIATASTPLSTTTASISAIQLGNFSFAGNNKPSDMTTFLFQIRMRLARRRGDQRGLQDHSPAVYPAARITMTSPPTPYTDDSSIEVVLRTLRENGKRLDYAVEEYPLKWPDEE